ncbi:LytR/AlgR family response regulator transcription factor [Larkinella punicea]|uniref:DNA-binding response regulator n=1 Tax=Larkinella punicea TaxID=2315727 RepID=A0A368JJP1_9BACT|nr:LytTR family DNA-binding domain-containing protein [Larkinella punicea]RCR67742.1 DNA-binding response regulator [Larkinella punicea]
MIKAIVVDDEADGRAAIAMALARYCPEVFIAESCETPEAGVRAIHAHKPDLVFLDIQMPRMSGFDVLQKLSPITFEVVFVSAYDRYAIQAIKFSALDYLLKPLDVDELIQAVRKVEERLRLKNNPFGYQSVLHNLQFRDGKIKRLAVPALDGISFFDTDSIIFCRADGSYTTLYMRNKQQVVVAKKLKDFETLLAESDFCRVHHSALINVRHVQKYVKGEGGYVILSEGHHIDVSRRKKEDFLRLMDLI